MFPGVGGADNVTNAKNARGFEAIACLDNRVNWNPTDVRKRRFPAAHMVRQIVGISVLCGSMHSAAIDHLRLSAALWPQAIYLKLIEIIQNTKRAGTGNSYIHPCPGTFPGDASQPTGSTVNPFRTQRYKNVGPPKTDLPPPSRTSPQ